MKSGSDRCFQIMLPPLPPLPPLPLPPIWHNMLSCARCNQAGGSPSYVLHLDTSRLNSPLHRIDYTTKLRPQRASHAARVSPCVESPGLTRVLDLPQLRALRGGHHRRLDEVLGAVALNVLVVRRPARVQLFSPASHTARALDGVPAPVEARRMVPLVPMRVVDVVKLGAGDGAVHVRVCKLGLAVLKADAARALFVRVGGHSVQAELRSEPERD